MNWKLTVPSEKKKKNMNQHKNDVKTHSENQGKDADEYDDDC